MTDPTVVLIELHRNILLTCEDYGVQPQDLCVMARSKMITALKRLDGFPDIATCENDDIPEQALSNGTYNSAVYVIQKARVASYGLTYSE